MDLKEVKPEKLYSLEFPDKLSDAELQHIQDQLEPYRVKFGCQFMVLDGRARLRDPAVPDEQVLNAIAELVADKIFAALDHRGINKLNDFGTADGLAGYRLGAAKRG